MKSTVQQLAQLEEGEEVQDGRGEGSSSIGDEERAAVSLIPGIDRMHVCIFESSQLDGLYVGNLLYHYIHCYIPLLSHTLKFCPNLYKANSIPLYG